MEWQHLRVMTCHINLIKEDSEGQEEGGKNIVLLLGLLNFCPKKIHVTLHASPVCGCWCASWPESLHSRTLQFSLPRAAGSSFRSTGRSPLSPWLIALIHSDWLAFTLRGKTGRSGVGLSCTGISRSFHTTSHWMHIHNVFGLTVENTGMKLDQKGEEILLLSLFCHRHSHIWANTEIILLETATSIVIFCIHLRDVVRPPAPPSLCRWRCHMWQFWSKRGVELPACWGSALCDSCRRTRLRRGPSCSTQSPSQQKYFFSLWDEVVCWERAALIQNHGQRFCAARERDGNKQRRVKFQHHLFLNSPYTVVRDQTEAEKLGMIAKITLMGSKQGGYCLVCKDYSYDDEIIFCGEYQILHYGCEGGVAEEQPQQRWNIYQL